jgi:hypothetical protein
MEKAWATGLTKLPQDARYEYKQRTGGDASMNGNREVWFPAVRYGIV